MAERKGFKAVDSRGLGAMTTDNRTNEPTPEQIVSEALGTYGLIGRARDLAARNAVERLRTHGLLSEGAPSEKQARAIRKLDNVQAILAGAQASVTDAVRELSLTSAALEAAGVAPQVPLGDLVFRAAAAIAETQARRQNLPPEVIQGVTREHMQDAKAALTAAGVAPQVPSRLPDFFAPKPMSNSYVPAQVLPSSGIDEDALANLIHSTSVAHFGGLDPRVAPIIARAVAEFLKGEER